MNPPPRQAQVLMKAFLPFSKIVIGYFQVFPPELRHIIAHCQSECVVTGTTVLLCFHFRANVEVSHAARHERFYEERNGSRA